MPCCAPLGISGERWDEPVIPYRYGRTVAAVRERRRTELHTDPGRDSSPPDPAPPLSLQSSAELVAAPSLSVGGTLTLRFCRDEFPAYQKGFRSEAVSPILNKAGQLNASPALRLILGQVAPKFDLARAMDHRGILVANLAKGSIGESASNLLGSLLVSHLQFVAMGRAAVPPPKRTPFFVHVDEFQTFSSEAFASLLSEARKFATHFTLANQYTDQLSQAVRAAVIGNAGSLVVFRVGSRDAELLAPEFRPIERFALADQEPFTAWLRRSAGSHRVAIEPRLYEPLGSAEIIRHQSRRNFGRPRNKVEQLLDLNNA